MLLVFIDFKGLFYVASFEGCRRRMKKAISVSEVPFLRRRNFFFKYLVDLRWTLFQRCICSAECLFMHAHLLVSSNLVSCLVEGSVSGLHRRKASTSGGYTRS